MLRVSARERARERESPRAREPESERARESESKRETVTEQVTERDRESTQDHVRMVCTYECKPVYTCKGSDVCVM